MTSKRSLTAVNSEEMRSLGILQKLRSRYENVQNGDREWRILYVLSPDAKRYHADIN